MDPVVKISLCRHKLMALWRTGRFYMGTRSYCGDTAALQIS